MTILLPNSFENSYLKYQLQEFQKVKVCSTSTVQFLNTYIKEVTIYLCNVRHQHFVIGPNVCVCIYIYIYIYTYMPVYIHTHVYVCTHTHTHTHTHFISSPT